MKGLLVTTQEQGRIQVLNEVMGGTLRVTEAASLLGVSQRHAWRLLGAYRRDGVAAVAHGNRGRAPAHTLPAGLRQQVLTLAQPTYRGCNDCHLVELLAEREGIRRSPRHPPLRIQSP